MAKRKIEGGEQPQTSEEVLELRKRLAVLEEQVKAQKAEPFEEIRKASVAALGNNQQITVKHFTDHKKVALYHTNGYHIGKKIGPLHPGLLEYTFTVFKRSGVILSVKCPTAEEIAEYKKGAEYKAAAARMAELKPNRGKPETGTDIKRLADAMSTLAGIAPADLIQIKAK
jgi:hypothetical protein